GLGDADDDARAPSAVAAFQSRAHHFGVAGRVERIIGAAVGDLQHLVDDRLAVLALAVDEVGHTELAAPFLAVGVDVDADDPGRAHKRSALHDIDVHAG